MSNYVCMYCILFMINGVIKVIGNAKYLFCRHKEFNMQLSVTAYVCLWKIISVKYKIGNAIKWQCYISLMT